MPTITSTTTSTVPAVPAGPKPWEVRLRLNSDNAKWALRNNDFTYLSVLRATQETIPMALDSTDPSSTISQADKDNLENINASTVGHLNNKYDDFSNKTNALKDDPDKTQSNWEAKIKANGDTLKQQSDAAIDASTNDAIAKIGQLPPASQDAASNIFLQGRNAVFGFVNTIQQKVMDVFNKVTDFLKGIWDSLQNAFNSVKDAAESAINSITGIFSFAVMPAALLRVTTSHVVNLDWAGVQSVTHQLAAKGYVADSKPVKTTSGTAFQVSVHPLIADTADTFDRISQAIEAAVAEATKVVAGGRPVLAS